MATSVTPSNLTVTISEQINLNNQDINSSNELVIANINEFDKRIVTVLSSAEQTLLLFSTTVAAGQYIGANVKYIRITNLDNTNFCRIRVKKNGADTFDVKVEAGKSVIMGNVSESVSATAASFSAFVTADSINAQADTASVDLEIAVASI